MSRFVVPADGEDSILHLLGEDEYVSLVIQRHRADLEFLMWACWLPSFEPVLPDNRKTAIVILIIHVGEIVAVVVLNIVVLSQHIHSG